jgi:hypothetical protein
MDMAAHPGREFWHGVLVEGGYTAIPRWTSHPVAGAAEHAVAVPYGITASVRRVADEVAVPVGSVLLAAHAKVLAVLSGEAEVVTGYVGAGGAVVPCRVSAGPR